MPTLTADGPTRVRWRVFSLSFATSLLLYLHRYVFAFIKPTLAREWGLTSTELGQLDSAFSICYASFQFPFALVADMLGVHVVLSGLMILWCGGLCVMAWAPTRGWMGVGLVTLGTGQSAVYACLNRIARTWFPPAVRTTLQGAVGVLAGRLGALASSLVFTSLLLGVCGLDWRTAIWILAAVGGAQCLAFAVFFRNEPRTHPGVNEPEARLIAGVPADAAGPVAPTAPLSLRQAVRGTNRRAIRNLLWLSVQTILSTFADNIYSAWIPLFLAQVHRLEFKKMGVYSALPLLGGALAGLLGGLLNDFLIARTGNRRWSRVAVALVGKGLAAVLMFIALLYYDQPYAFCSILFFVKLFGDWSLSTAWGVVTDIGGRATASVFAFHNSLAGLGLIAAPLVFGPLADRYGWRTVFATVGVTYVLCALSWLFINCTIPLIDEQHGATAEHDVASSSSHGQRQES